MPEQSLRRLLKAIDSGQAADDADEGENDKACGSKYSHDRRSPRVLSPALSPGLPVI